MEDNKYKEINEAFKVENPSLQALHAEADEIQAYMDKPAYLEDPASLTYRLNDLDTYMARLTDMMIRAKAMKERAKNKYLAENEDKLNKLTATVSNRLIDAHLFEYNMTYNRLDSIYHTLEHLTRDLVTQISYIKQQMQNLG